MPRYVQSRASDATRRTMEKLLMAIRANSLEAFERILDQEGLPSASNNLDFKLLKKTLVYGRSKMAQSLLDRGCRAHRQFYNGNSPLHLAASKRNSAKLVRRLLDRGARVDHKNRNQETPLHVAFNLAEGKVVDLMLEEHLTNSFVNVTNRIGLTFLHITATRPQLENVARLFQFGSTLLDCQVDVNADSPYAGFTPLHMAVEFNRPKVAELLLNHGANLWTKDANGSTPLHLALERRDIDMLELLFLYDYKRENYVNDFGLSHFMASCVCSDSLISLDYLANPVNSKTALINERVNKFGDNLCYPFKNYTPLHFAAEYGRQNTIQLLLLNGATCQARNSSGLMPEHLAAINSFQDASDLFMMHCLAHGLQLEIDSHEEVGSPMGSFENDYEDGDSVINMCDSGCEDDSGFWEEDIECYMLHCEY